MSISAAFGKRTKGSGMDVLLRSARLGPDEPPIDVLVRGDRIELISSAVADWSGPAIELDGRLVLPGLWDHHVHFDQWAMTRRRVDLSPATSAAHTASIAAAALDASNDPVLVGFGYRDALWSDPPSAALLDELTGSRPVVLVSADLHSVWLNTAGLTRFGCTEHRDGRVVEQAAHRVFEALTDIDDATLDDWADQAGRAAAARGVVGIVDLESPLRLDAWRRRIGNGSRSLRVQAGVWTPRLDDVITAGHRSGDEIEATGGLLRMGPFKVITDGSLNTRTAYCHDPYPGLREQPYGILQVPPEELVPLMTRAHNAGLRCAIHAIGDHANSLALDAFAVTGARGSIEHAQLLDHADVARFASLDVAASVQPEHAMDDRDVADHHWAGRTERAFMLRSLLDAGARLTLGSDAPVAPLDPWRGIAAAVTRSRDGRDAWHPEQAITMDEALAASTEAGGRRGDRARLHDGAVTDLVVLDADLHLDQLATMPVAATMTAGAWTFGFDSQA